MTIFRGPTPDIVIPDAALHDHLLERARERSAKVAIIDGAGDSRGAIRSGPSGRAPASWHSLTYGELADAVRSTAAGFTALGLRKGDVVAIDAPNSPDWVVAFLAVSMAGGVITTASPLFTASELGRQLTDSRARFLVTSPDLQEKARAAAAASAVERIVVFGDESGRATVARRPASRLRDAGTPGSAAVRPAPQIREHSTSGSAARAAAVSVISFAELQSPNESPRITFDTANDLLVMPFSSGTTGMPKGVMLTHRNLVANIEQALAVERTSGDDTVLGVLPFFHIYGMVCIMGMALRAGATIVTLPRFDLDVFLHAIQTHRVTCANLVPPIAIALAKHPAVDRYDLSSLRNITSGAAPLGADVQDACATRIGCTVRQGYGLTETSPVTHLTPHPPGKQKPGSVGPPLPNTEVMIVDFDGQPLPPDRPGEVWIRGPQVMKGYFRNPEATAAMIGRDGWLRTGDIGRADSDGYLTIVDRVKEMIKYNAYQVAPAELEAVLLTHPAIADAAVVGAPDDEAGEVPRAFIVASAPLSEQDVIDFVANRVAPYKKIRQVRFRTSIPKSPSGKILRRELRCDG